MPDIFQAFARDDDEPSVHFEIMVQQGDFWYISASFAEETLARAHMAELLAGPDPRGVLIDRVTREVVERGKRSKP